MVYMAVDGGRAENVGGVRKKCRIFIAFLWEKAYIRKLFNLKPIFMKHLFER